MSDEYLMWKELEEGVKVKGNKIQSMHMLWSTIILSTKKTIIKQFSITKKMLKLNLQIWNIVMNYLIKNPAGKSTHCSS